MSAGDGRHKIASAEEALLHGEIARTIRTVVNAYCTRRQAAQRAAEGHELKKSVFQAEIAEQLGITIRQLDNYGSTVPITLSKAILLSRFCRDERLLALFGRAMGAVNVALPLLDSMPDLARANEELAANMKEFSEAQQAALEITRGRRLDPVRLRAIFKEGWESIRQLLRVMATAELLCHGEVKFHLATWARRHNESGPPDVPGFVDPTQPRPGWWPEIGYSADDPE